MLLPRPRFGGNVVKDLQPLLFGPLGYLEVEARVVNQNHYVGVVGGDIGLALLHLAANRADIHQYVEKTEERGFAVVLYKVGTTSRLGHQIPAPKAKFRLRVGLFQPLNQFRAVQIARWFTHD